jgi:hypothetical protein
LYSDNFSKEFVTNKTYFEINQLAEGNYHLEVSDANSKIQKSSFTLDGFVDTPISLVSQWVLEERNALIVRPTIRDASSIKKYEWFTNDGTFISSDEGLSVSQPGYYQLLVTHQSGCRKSFNFEVKEKVKGAPNGWMVYPNPVKANENFVVKMQFLKPEKTIITIYDESGRLLKTKDLGMVKEYEYKDALSVSGTFLLSLNHNNEVQTCKVIIK